MKEVHVLRRARCFVLETLYELENSVHDLEIVYERRLSEIAKLDAELATPGTSGFAKGLLRGVWQNRLESDVRIQRAAPKYPVESIAVIDRSVLRLAIWELLVDNSAPVGAVVNEAVELARSYGSDSSPGFVNGVLRTISAEISEQRKKIKEIE